MLPGTGQGEASKALKVQTYKGAFLTCFALGASLASPVPGSDAP